ncbi:uncharacterized protein LOC112272041 [Brachypodium distachyon]|uniref:uncharacterized protein LOC112272041 n=1 Tax=Brachypodium distachyon TaxID=15368 RepID=UPI000D0CE555|nr:uncharacterized protein LOC112272041 [Brachypodium distachyon]|eukprot:XP_024318331.1 uncharacterized protein LOC112272041 [Brachypodium distachyon]
MLTFLHCMAGPCPMCSESNDTDDAKEEPAQERPRQILGAITASGLHISALFTCLMLAADALMGTSPEKGSQMERIGSILKELGVLGGNAITCFIVVPAMVSQAWMVLQRGWVVQCLRTTMLQR